MSIFKFGETEEEAIAACNEKGLVWARMKLADDGFTPWTADVVREWISEQESELFAERERQAMRSIEAAERSAWATERAARYAMWAALISLVIAATTVIPKLFDWLSNLNS